MNTPEKKPTLADVQAQFAHWRTTRRHRCPIPQELWDAALSLVGKHSTLEISKALNITHSKLKKRVPVSPPQNPLPADFVKLGVIQPPAAPPSCVLEVSDKNGATMTVSMSGAPFLNIMELVEAFWSRNP
jgi:hypothetical protein